MDRYENTAIFRLKIQQIENTAMFIKYSNVENTENLKYSKFYHKPRINIRNIHLKKQICCIFNLVYFQN